MRNIEKFICLGYFSLIFIGGIMLFLNEPLVNYPSKYKKLFSWLNFITNFFSTSLSPYYIFLYQLNCLVFVFSGLVGCLKVLMPRISYKFSLYPFTYGIIVFWLTTDSPFVYKLEDILNKKYLVKLIYTVSEIAIYIGFLELVKNGPFNQKETHQKEKKV